MDIYRFLLMSTVAFIHCMTVNTIPVPSGTGNEILTGNESQLPPSDNHHHQVKSSRRATVPSKRDLRKLDMSIPSNRAVLEIFYEWEMLHGGFGIIQSRYRRSARSKRAAPQQRPSKRSKLHGRRRSQYKRHENAFIRAMHKKYKGKTINLETALRRLFRQIYVKNRGFGKSWIRYG